MELKKEVNAGLRSVIISTNDTLTIDQLYRDYIKLNGSPVPLRELGAFRSLHEYLLSVPESITLDNPDSPYSIVRAASNEKTKHIAQLVREQKSKKKSSRRYPPRRPVGRRSVHTFVPIDLVRKISNYLIRYPDGIHLDDFQANIEEMQRAMHLVCDFDAVLQRISSFTAIRDDYIFLTSIMQNQHLKNVQRVPTELCIVSSSDLSDDCDYEDFLSESSDRTDEYPYVVNSNSQTDRCNYKSHGDDNHAGSSRESDYRPYGEPVETNRRPLKSRVDSDEVGINLFSENLIKNLRSLLDENPNGIWLAQLSKKYESKFGYSLNPNQHGFDSVLDLVTNMNHVFRMQQFERSGDKRLLDARKYIEEPEQDEGELPKSVVADIKKMLSQRVKSQVYTDELAEEYKKCYKKTLDPVEFGFNSMDLLLQALNDRECSTFSFKTIKERVVIYLRQHSADQFSASSQINSERALPDISYNFFPKGVCTYDFKLPVNPILHEIRKGQRVRVKIAEAYTPERFHLHFLDDVVDLDDMMDDLDQFYRNNAEEFEVFHDTVRRGLYCACIFAGNSKWHRVQVITTRGATNAKVRFFDYGTTDDVSINKLRYLHLDFAKLPALSVRAKLNGVKAKTSSDGLAKYTSLVNETFYGLANTDHLEAEILNADFINQSIDVNLYIKEDEDKEVPLHEKLISLGIVERKEIDDSIQILELPNTNVTAVSVTPNLPQANGLTLTQEPVNKSTAEPSKNRLPPGISLPNFQAQTQSQHLPNNVKSKLNPNVISFYPVNSNPYAPQPIPQAPPMQFSPYMMPSRNTVPVSAPYGPFTPRPVYDYYGRPIYATPMTMPTRPPPGIHTNPNMIPGHLRNTALNIGPMIGMQNGFVPTPHPYAVNMSQMQNGFGAVPTSSSMPLMQNGYGTAPSCSRTQFDRLPKTNENKAKAQCCCVVHGADSESSKCEDADEKRPEWVIKLGELKNLIVKNPEVVELKDEVECNAQEIDAVSSKLESLLKDRKASTGESSSSSNACENDNLDENYEICDRDKKIELLKNFVISKNKNFNRN